MERDLYRDLLKWKNSPYRKPLVLFGARQTGKTWLLKEFGHREYKNLAYINCDNNPDITGLFFDFNIERLIRSFSVITEQIIQKHDTLIILDEVQEVPMALTALKYFSENAPEYHIAVAGSFLGINVHKGSGYPVGKVDELYLYPLSFLEFLKASGNNSLVEMMQEHHWTEFAPLHERCRDLLRQYYFTGGMPEVVQHYVINRDVQEVRNIQRRILRDYRSDFSKHIPAPLLSKVNLVWDSIPSHLAKENKKFVYGAVKKGARAKDLEDAIQWLLDTGLVFKVNRVSKIEMPLKFYEEFGSFKLFLNDLGLLGAMVDVPIRMILLKDNFLEEYKGAFTEQYVGQQLTAVGIKPYYYTNERSTLEIDFVIQKENVYPIEVKAEENLRSKSLRTIVTSGNNLTGWRFSMSDYRVQDWMINIPLYLVQEWVTAAD